MFPLVVLSFVVPFAASTVLTARVRDHALSRGILDTPTARSSHSQPTPRGGGLAVVVVVLAGIFVLGGLRVLSPRVVIALSGGVIPVAAAGWLDDVHGVSAMTRGIVHVLSAAWSLSWLGGFPVVHVGAAQVDLGIWGSIIALVAIVWSANLFNFMDGIDGLAAGEALTVGLALGVILIALHRPGLASLPLLVAGGSAGLLMWNWQPAKIFMGDVGSGSLGFLFGVTAIMLDERGAISAVAIAMLLGVFVFDSTVTLLRRALHGEVIHAAHRSHAYQRAVQSGFTHAAVSTVVLTVNALLAVLAWLSIRQPRITLALVAIELAVLSALYLTIERRRPMSFAPSDRHVSRG